MHPAILRVVLLLAPEQHEGGSCMTQLQKGQDIALDGPGNRNLNAFPLKKSSQPLSCKKQNVNQCQVPPLQQKVGGRTKDSCIYFYAKLIMQVWDLSHRIMGELAKEKWRSSILCIGSQWQYQAPVQARLCRAGVSNIWSQRRWQNIIYRELF